MYYKYVLCTTSDSQDFRSMEKSESHEDPMRVGDTNQLKRQLARLEKEQRAITKEAEDFKQSSKKVLQNLENDSNYYMAHIRDIEYSRKVMDKEIMVKEEQSRVAEERNVNLKKIKNEYLEIVQEKESIEKTTAGIVVKPKSYDHELKDAEVAFKKYSNRYNSYQDVNLHIREKISGLVKEKMLFEEQYMKYTVELKNLKSKIAVAIDQCNQNFEMKEEYKSKIVQLNEKNEKEKNGFLVEMLDLERLVKEKREERQFKEKKQETRTIIEITTVSKDDLKKENDIKLLRELEELSGYLETFKNYKSTFLSDFKAKEMEIKSLYSFVCEMIASMDHTPQTAQNDVVAIQIESVVDPVEPRVIVKEKPLTSVDYELLQNCAVAVGLTIDLQEEMNFDYFIAKTIDPSTYYAQIDYQLDKLTHLASIKKAVIENEQDVLGSFRQQSASTLSSEKPNAKERLIVTNPPLLEVAKFPTKSYPSIDAFCDIKATSFLHPDQVRMNTRELDMSALLKKGNRLKVAKSTVSRSRNL